MPDDFPLVCGMLGCQHDADVLVATEIGTRVACQDCAADYEVVDDV